MLADRQTVSDASLGLISQGVGSATDWAADKISSKVAARFAAKAGSRMIPGIGTALLAYDAVDLGLYAFTGKSLSDRIGETAVGRRIGSAVSSAGTSVFGAAGKLFDNMGFTSAGSYVRQEASSYFFGAEVPSPSPAGREEAVSQGKTQVNDLENHLPFGTKQNPRSVIDQALKMFGSAERMDDLSMPALGRRRGRDFGLD
ncbi:hypothetical protein [Microvirga sp. VF16]|uniref:hypothetical protein n=1 Tax=Microvirga sp. VF16 TaxID=2807101 RepID=UPI00193E0375|nr:hypothetical protein [Microvirga sp. VF16]QRM34996.1 hypothetical protein JO965_42815 [Microvirga sp. VF16]